MTKPDSTPSNGQREPHDLTIWIDADACPRKVRDLILRASKRLCIPLVFVADRQLQLPPRRRIRSIVVNSGIDEADDRIVDEVCEGDLVITGDLPLADRIIARGAEALDPRGTLYTDDNIKERVAVRNLRQELRDAGIMTGGPAGYDARDAHAFAGAFDRWLTRRLR